MRKRILFSMLYLCFSLTLIFSASGHANVLNYQVNLNPGEDAVVPITVEPSDASLTVEIVQGSGDIDLYLMRNVMTGDVIIPDFASESPSWQERITVDSSTNPPISQGEWIIDVYNRNGYPVSAVLSISSQTATASSGGSSGTTGTTNTSNGGAGSSASNRTNPNFRPQVGLWYNKSKPGHGIDLELSGQNLAAVWYTYNPDSTPTWYLAIGPYSGQSTWTATLNKYHWNGSSATPTPVGTITFEFKNRTKATFSWNLNGQSGSEPMERFIMADDVPQTNLTGLWYNSSEPGYGYSIDTQGDTVAIVAYFYDSNGEPRWALNSSQGSPFSSGSLPATVFFGPCPNCSGTNFHSASAGTITRNFSDASHGSLGVNITLPPPMNSSWSKPEASVVILSQPVNNNELELEGAVDYALGLFSDSGDMLGGLTDSFSGLNLSNIQSSTCPRITYGDLSNLNLAGPMHIPLKVDFGTGCSDKQGNTWSGTINAPLNATLGASNMHLDTNISMNHLVKNGQLLGNGSASIVIDLAKAGSSDKYSGTGQINLNLTGPDNEQVTGQIGLQFTNVDLAPLFSMQSGSGGSTFASLLQVVGTSGSININLNNLVAGPDSASGTITMTAQSAGVGRLDLNLQTNKGPVQGSFLIRRGASDSDIFISTLNPATISNYQVTINDLEINAGVCTDSPVGGAMTVTKGSNSGRFTFDTSCLGYTFTGL